LDLTGRKWLEAGKELHNLYASLNVIRVIKSRRMRWTGRVARKGEIRNAYNMLVRKPEGKRALGRPRHRWEDMRMHLREIGWEVVDGIHLAQDRDQWLTVVNTVMNLLVP
jgi:Lhr-like helicase